MTYLDSINLKVFKFFNESLNLRYRFSNLC